MEFQFFKMNIYQVFIVLILYCWIYFIYQITYGEFLICLQVFLLSIILKIGLVNIYISDEKYD
jgi:hypothetical protein